MKFLSVIIELYSKHISAVNWQVQFLWSSLLRKIRHKFEFSSYYDLSNEFLPNDRYVTSTQCEISKSRLNYWRDGLLSWARLYHSENWFFWSYKKWRVTCSQCRSVYSDDSERHLRESNITETNIGILCSVYFVELDHEILNWDMDGIREMC